MLETKKITISDCGAAKVFTITALPARSAIKLAGKIASLCRDTELISAVVAQQFIHKVLSTGVEIEEADPEKAKEEQERRQMLRQMMQMDAQSVITHLLKSLMAGLSDENIDMIIDKALEGTIYHNGSVDYSALDALNHNMIKDFTVILALLHEIFTLNFSGAIERLKKFQESRTQTKTSAA